MSGTTDISESNPPSVEVANNGTPSDLLRMASGDSPMPQFGAEVSKGAVEPTLVQRVNPIYPPQARIQEITGEVVLDASIGKDGMVKKVSVISGPAMLAGAAAAAVHQWRYSPALLNGKPIETQKRITVVFKLP
jgi:protein TonB